MQVLDEAPGVGPATPFGEGEVVVVEGFGSGLFGILGVIEDVEGGLVAPRLDDQHRGGNLVFEGQRDLLAHFGLAVPIVRGHPRT